MCPLLIGDIVGRNVIHVRYNVPKGAVRTVNKSASVILGSVSASQRSVRRLA